jgi:hypothetical protein
MILTALHAMVQPAPPMEVTGRRRLPAAEEQLMSDSKPETDLHPGDAPPGGMGRVSSPRDPDSEISIDRLGTALAQARRSHGPDHEDTLALANRLAGAYHDQGRWRRAISLYAWTLAARRRVLGQDHRDTLISMNNLACAYRDAGDPRGAVTLHEQTLLATGRVTGADHPQTLVCATNLADAYQAAGMHELALEIYEHTLTVACRLLGADHELSATVRAKLHALPGQRDR